MTGVRHLGQRLGHIARLAVPNDHVAFITFFRLPLYPTERTLPTLSVRCARAGVSFLVCASRRSQGNLYDPEPDTWYSMRLKTFD